MPKTTIHSVRLFDGHRVHDSAAVTFDSTTGLIESVNLNGDAPNPDNITGSKDILIDGSGNTLLPGLIEAHIHLGEDDGDTAAQDLRLSMATRCGITTICDMGGDAPTTKAHRQRILAQAREAHAASTSAVVPTLMPDLKTAMEAATVAGGWPAPIMLAMSNNSAQTQAQIAKWPKLTIENARDYVLEQRAHGADYIKLMQENSRSMAMPTNSFPVASLEVQQAIVNAAHSLDHASAESAANSTGCKPDSVSGMLVVAHAMSKDMTELVLQAGVDGLAHCFFDERFSADKDSTLQLFLQTKAFMIPTLVVIASGTSEEQARRDKFAALALHRGLVAGGHDSAQVQTLCGCHKMAAAGLSVENAIDTLQQLRRHGIDIVAGTDSVPGLPGTLLGPSLWMELELYVERVGMTAVQALASATGVAAARFRMADRGVVETGRRADLVLVNGDVTHDVAKLWSEEGGILGVWKEGIRGV